jgi:TolB-like protein
LAIYFRGKPAPAQPLATFKSIAVLPFKPLVATSGDSALELGMTDALINKLANIRQITVRPTSSVMKYANANQDLRVAAQELNVDALLDGKVQRDGDRIRLSVQLVRAADSTPLWAENFDTQFKDIFAVQDTISEKVARSLALKLNAEEQKGLSKRYTDSAEAYQLYLAGRAQWRTFLPPNLLTSINYYRAALEKDSNYALAHAGIAASYTVIGIYGPMSARDAMPKAQEAARKAVELDDNLSQAHLSLGLVKLLYEWDWPGAKRELERANELDPTGEGRSPYGYYFEAMRQSDESLAQLKLARELAPGWDIANTDYAWHLFIERHFDEAIAVIEKELKLDPRNPSFHLVLGMTYTQQRKYQQAVEELKLSILGFEERHDPYTDVARSDLGNAFALMGKQQEALRLIAEVQKNKVPIAPLIVAEVYTALGDKDAAFA